MAKTLNELQFRIDREVKRLKSLHLTDGPETQYARSYRMWVPRSRVIGCDGTVRTTRKRNEEPMSRPKNSDYSRLYLAFTKMRSDGAYAKWNIDGDGHTDYWCNLPEVIRKRIVEYNSKTAPVANYYKDQNKFTSINGIGTVDEIFESISTVVETF